MIVDVDELARIQREAAAEGQHNVAYVALVNESGFPHVGQIDYSGNRVDPDTGTIEIRAVFANPDPEGHARRAHLCRRTW